MEQTKTEIINLDTKKPLPEDYACDCAYCKQYKGMLIRENGKLYNRNERRQYMEWNRVGGAGHINPTPLHIARWAIQKLTKEYDYVIDPFLGTGTTAVEAVNHLRYPAGCEIDTIDLCYRNITKNIPEETDISALLSNVHQGDARNIGTFLRKIPPAQLVILHPPYSGDEQANAKYDKAVVENMAFMKESSKYWSDMKLIFDSCIDLLAPGGYVVIGIKEMMRNKKWWDLHIKFNNIIMSEDRRMKFNGMILLPHYPRTLHLNTYFKRWGVHPSYYQTISIFKKR